MKRSKNTAERINYWTISHFKEIFKLIDKNGKEIDYTIRVEKRKPRKART